MLRPERNRFRAAFYLSENSNTTLAELNHHGKTGTHTIHFSVNPEAARVLDLTNPSIAKEWRYNRGEENLDKTRDLADRARENNYNVIRFPSERGVGSNLAVLSDFGKILVPQMVVPAEEFDLAILTALSNELGGR